MNHFPYVRHIHQNIVVLKIERYGKELTQGYTERLEAAGNGSWCNLKTGFIEFLKICISEIRAFENFYKCDQI